MGIETLPTSRPVLAAVAYAMGRSAGRLVPAANASSSSIRPLAGGVAIGALWGTVYGLVNLRRYRRKQISKRRAVHDTAKESVGFGVSTAIGITAANVLRATTLIGSSAALVPFVLATATTGGAKILWDHMTRSESRVGPDDEHGGEDAHPDPDPDPEALDITL